MVAADVDIWKKKSNWDSLIKQGDSLIKQGDETTYPSPVNDRSHFRCGLQYIHTQHDPF